MAELPTGTVTFMFSDIEGSTRMVQKLGERWPDVLTQHCLILRSAITGNGGIELDTEGDSFFAVFSTADAAVRAAIEGQRALVAHSWPEDGRVRVRMGIHTGHALLGGANYIGLDVHRAARIADSAHGGQVVLSDSTRALVDASPIEGMELRDLGEHRLKDLARPERLSQLEIDGLDNEFPVLHTLDARPNNLPMQMTSFLGRGEEIHELSELLQTTRLVTLTGSGGTGKTRLALQAAAEVLPQFRDGVFFVELAPLHKPELVVSEIATTLGLRETSGASPAETLKEWLTGRQVLIVLDNFEHVIDAAPLIGDLLVAGDGIRVLVTSRIRLQLYGEHEYPVSPLPLPKPGESLASLENSDVVALFTERAQAVRRDFAITETTAPAVVEIARRLDGLPLAIELAAARVSLLGPEAMVARLGNTLDLLSVGPRDLPERQRTLRGAIDWSFNLLPENEQTLLSRLAVFSGGWSLPAVEDVCRPAELGLDALEAMASLAVQCLIRVEETIGGEPRFSMLATIREYATERLLDSDQSGETRQRHASYFLDVAEAAEPELEDSPELVARLGQDHDNLRAALSWAIETGDADTGLRLGYALWRFWQLMSHLREGRNWFEQLLRLPGAQEPGLQRARGLTGAAGVAYWQNDFEAATRWYEEAEAIFRQVDNRPGLAGALYNTGTMAMMSGDFELANTRFGEGVQAAGEIDNQAMLLKLLVAQGYVRFMADELADAREIVEEALRVAQSTGSLFDLSAAQHTMGQVDRLQGRFDAAAGHYRESIRTIVKLGSTEVVEPVQGLAAVAVATGDPLRGVRLLGGAEAIRERMGGGPPPEWIRLGDPLGDVRSLVGDEAVDRAMAEGKAMSDDEVTRYALKEN